MRVLPGIQNLQEVVHAWYLTEMKQELRQHCSDQILQLQLHPKVAVEQWEDNSKKMEKLVSSWRVFLLPDM